jgi:hypothetical protein
LICRNIIPVITSELPLIFVVALASNDMPDTAPWISDIAFPSWNQMYMAVEDCLPRGLATIHSDIKSIDR